MGGLLTNFDIKLFNFLDKRVNYEDNYDSLEYMIDVLSESIGKYIKYFGFNDKSFVAQNEVTKFFTIKYFCYSKISRMLGKGAIDLTFEDLSEITFHFRNDRFVNLFILNFLQFKCSNNSTTGSWIRQTNSAPKYLCLMKDFVDYKPFFVVINNEMFKSEWHTNFNAFDSLNLVDKVVMPPNIDKKITNLTTFEIDILAYNNIRNNASFKNIIYDNIVIAFKRGFNLKNNDLNRYFITYEGKNDRHFNIFFKILDIVTDHNSIFFYLKVISITDDISLKNVDPEKFDTIEQSEINDNLLYKIRFFITRNEFSFNVNTKYFSNRNPDNVLVKVKY